MLTHALCPLQSGGESIDVNQIRSVKVSRGARNIPKAFEIFTGDQTLILKPKDGKNAEEWVQCLSIVVAHSQVEYFSFTLSLIDLSFCGSNNIDCLLSRHVIIQWPKQTVFPLVDWATVGPHFECCASGIGRTRILSTNFSHDTLLVECILDVIMFLHIRILSKKYILRFK